MGPADRHHYFEGLAVAHVLGGLDDSEGQVFRAHLLECLNCRARVGELRAIAHDLADVERDERRVRAAQAIDTKRRETEDETDEADEPVPSARASRFLVLLGLTLMIGLALWNFTLRGALGELHQVNRNLVDAGVIIGSGEPWETTYEATGMSGSVTVKDGQYVIELDGLDPEQLYGLYVETEPGKFRDRYLVKSETGRVFRAEQLPEGATRIVVTDPQDMNREVARPGDRPGDGDIIFEATPAAD